MNKLSIVLLALGYTLSIQAAQPLNHTLPIEVLEPYCKTDYLRGTAQLTQLKTLDQLSVSQDEKEKGCTKGSCFYHALRNGIHIVKAVNDRTQASIHLNKLFDRKDFYNKASFEGPWRSLVVKDRKGTNSDMLTASEAEKLIAFEKAQDPAFTTEVALFDARYPLDHIHQEGIDRVKAQLKQPHSVALVLVFIGNQERQKDAPVADHWVSLVINNANGVHQYLLADSIEGSAPFAHSTTIKQLIDHIEDTPGSINGVVKYVAPTKKIKKENSETTFSQMKKPLLFGIISGAALFGISYYLKKDSAVASAPQAAILA